MTAATAEMAALEVHSVHSENYANAGTRSVDDGVERVDTKGTNTLQAGKPRASWHKWEAGLRDGGQRITRDSKCREACAPERKHQCQDEEWTSQKCT